MLFFIAGLFLIVAYAVLGLVTGIVVGHRLGGKVGAACLGIFLGLAPIATGYLAFQWLLISL